VIFPTAQVINSAHRNCVLFLSRSHFLSKVTTERFQYKKSFYTESVWTMLLRQVSFKQLLSFSPSSPYFPLLGSISDLVNFTGKKTFLFQY